MKGVESGHGRAVEHPAANTSTNGWSGWTQAGRTRASSCSCSCSCRRQTMLASWPSSELHAVQSGRWVSKCDETSCITSRRVTALCSSETLVPTHQNTLWHKAESCSCLYGPAERLKPQVLPNTPILLIYRCFVAVLMIQ
jgi:hypothetical protein